MSDALVSSPIPLTDLVLFFLAGPILGFLGYLVSLVTAGNPGSRTASESASWRMILAVLGIPSVLYGAVLMFVAAPIPTDPTSQMLTRDIGLAFSTVAVLTLGGMSYQVRQIGPAVERSRELLGRNLVLLVVPLSAMVFGLVLGFQQLHYLGLAYGVSPGSHPLGALRASLPWGYLMGAGGLAAAIAAGAVTDPTDERAFFRQVIRGVAAETVTLVGLFLALLPLASV